MIRPAHFGFNSLTALDNVYQNSFKEGMIESDVSKQASIEFDSFVSVLRHVGISVITFEDVKKNQTPYFFYASSAHVYPKQYQAKIDSPLIKEKHTQVD